jgi:Sodium/hydrogen exchanger family
MTLDHLPVESVLLVAAGLMVIGVLIVGASDRLRVPAALLCLGIGMVIGSDVLGLVDVSDMAMVRDISVIALMIILFEGGLTTKPSVLRESGVPGFVLANVGVLVSAAVVAVGVQLLFDSGRENRPDHRSSGCLHGRCGRVRRRSPHADPEAAGRHPRDRVGCQRPLRHPPHHRSHRGDQIESRNRRLVGVRGQAAVRGHRRRPVRRVDRHPAVAAPSEVLRPLSALGPGHGRAHLRRGVVPGDVGLSGGLHLRAHDRCPCPPPPPGGAELSRQSGQRGRHRVVSPAGAARLPVRAARGRNPGAGGDRHPVAGGPGRYRWFSPWSHSGCPGRR